MTRYRDPYRLGGVLQQPRPMPGANGLLRANAVEDYDKVIKLRPAFAEAAPY
jgi:hypothetical protein